MWGKEMSPVQKDIKAILQKLRREQKTPPPEVIPEDHVWCTRCGKLVPKADATVDLEISTKRKEVWVCDECFFKHAK